MSTCRRVGHQLVRKWSRRLPADRPARPGPANGACSGPCRRPPMYARATKRHATRRTARHPSRPTSGGAGRSSAGTEVGAAPAGLPASETRIGEWRLLRRLPTTSHVRERYEASRDTDEREAIVTLYALGSEPDPDVYEILRTLDRDHVPEVLETGLYGDRAYEVTEDLRGGTFADLGLVADDVADRKSTRLNSSH